MNSNICPNCGLQHTNKRICPNCGKVVKDVLDEQKKAKQNEQVSEQIETPTLDITPAQFQAQTKEDQEKDGNILATLAFVIFHGTFLIAAICDKISSNLEKLIDPLLPISIIVSLIIGIIGCVKCPKNVALKVVTIYYIVFIVGGGLIYLTIVNSCSNIPG